MKNSVVITFSKNKQPLNRHNIKILILLFVSINIWTFLPKKASNYSSNTISQSKLSFDSLPHNSQSSSNVFLSFENVSSFFDTFIPIQLEQRQVAGMTVSIVQGNEVLFAKGYGFANIWGNITVKANETLFRIGSISKSFVAIAVMQLVEQGILDLDEDINSYLTAFQIPDTYPEPITLHHLLTHTAGWEEMSHPILSVPFGSFETMLEETLPKRVRPPGLFSSYSNYGMSLAGYIVQKVSNKTFEDYLEDEIFLPLGMNFSTCDQPIINSNLSTYLSKGYDSNLVAKGFEYILLPPCGALSSTATDMAQYMIALLNNGSMGDSRILNNDTIQEMLSPQFVIRPNFPAILYGFYEQTTNSEYSFGHGGDTQYFHSLMTLFPESQIGFFVSYNTEKYSLREEILQAFVDLYFPHNNSEQIDLPEGSKSRAIRCLGTYLTSRRPYVPNELLSLKDIYSWMDDQFEVTLNTNGTINVFGLAFSEIGPYLFRKDIGSYNYFIAFKENDQGEIQYCYLSWHTPTIGHEKLNLGYSSDLGWRILIIIILLVYSFSLLLWSVMLIYRKWKKNLQKSPFSILGRGLFLLILIGSVIFIDQFSKILTENIILDDNNLENFQNINLFSFFLTISICATIIISILSWFNVDKKFFQPSWLKWEKVHYSFASVCGIGFVWIMFLLNLL
ncbi:MAG: serine hydrolase domain-containing protein [Candidatus Hodarchaeales archaeon]|jgi:CubicO group peptidase (beta-lactamase class C family)